MKKSLLLPLLSLFLLAACDEIDYSRYYLPQAAAGTYIPCEKGQRAHLIVVRDLDAVVQQYQQQAYKTIGRLDFTGEKLGASGLSKYAASQGATLILGRQTFLRSVTTTHTRPVTVTDQVDMDSSLVKTLNQLDKSHSDYKERTTYTHTEMETYQTTEDIYDQNYIFLSRSAR